MRRDGIALPKWKLREGLARSGTLEVLDTRENSYNRIIKLAKFVADHGGTETLYEARLLWMSGDRFCMTGFERKQVGANVADYAQSWVCALGEKEYDPDNARMMPPADNFRL